LREAVDASIAAGQSAPRLRKDAVDRLCTLRRSPLHEPDERGQTQPDDDFRDGEGKRLVVNVVCRLSRDSAIDKQRPGARRGGAYELRDEVRPGGPREP
jgi:hypothetical protein